MEQLGHSDRGSMSLETVMMVPLVFVMAGVLILTHRLASASITVHDAAGAGARAATLSRTSAEAEARSRGAVNSTLVTLNCTQTLIVNDLSGFNVPVGQSATISTNVICTVPLSDLGLPIPGSKNIEATAVSPLDRFRGRD